TEHKSNQTEITTLDTTSHNFTWQTFEFGQHSSSVLYDVAIIDENNIWAVGEIFTTDSYTYDSLGNWIDPYNAIHWNGSVWELVRIYYNYNGSKHWSPIRTILAFSDSDIWFGAGIHWNGMAFQTKPMDITFPYQINKMWGISSSDFYIVGNSGSIAHWNGSSWKKIESGTNLNIYDIWGDYNKIHQSYEIIVVAAKHMTSLERKLLILKNNSTNELSTTNISQGSLHGIWFKNEKRYYVVGNGIYTKGKISSLENWKRIDNGLTQNYIYGISGTDYNNIFLCGSFGESLHYNGVSWQSYRDTPGFFKNEFFNTAIKGNTVVVVGYDGNKAFIAKGDN
ncbi:MAG: glucosyl transferase, partial [Ignavibacteriaceae bacterium]|nr:glucosyl transferase [Ignavibacteriaceae bacterium]